MRSQTTLKALGRHRSRGFTRPLSRTLGTMWGSTRLGTPSKSFGGRPGAMGSSERGLSGGPFPNGRPGTNPSTPVVQCWCCTGHAKVLHRHSTSAVLILRDYSTNTTLVQLWYDTATGATLLQ